MSLVVGYFFYFFCCFYFLLKPWVSKASYVRFVCLELLLILESFIRFLCPLPSLDLDDIGGPKVGTKSATSEDPRLDFR